jgi:hypothetical protein
VVLEEALEKIAYDNAREVLAAALALVEGGEDPCLVEMGIP